MTIGGAVWSMEVVVNVPDLQCCRTFPLGAPFAGVEELFGDDPVVRLYFPVVPWRVRRDPGGPIARRTRKAFWCTLIEASVGAADVGANADLVALRIGEYDDPRGWCVVHNAAAGGDGRLDPLLRDF